MATGGEASSSEEVGLGDDDLKRMYDILFPVSSKSQLLGVQLGLSHAEIRNIHTQYADSGIRLLEVLGSRIRKAEPLTWKCIYEALDAECIGEHKLAKKVQEKYCPFSSTQTISNEHDNKRKGKVEGLKPQQVGEMSEGGTPPVVKGLKQDSEKGVSASKSLVKSNKSKIDSETSEEEYLSAQEDIIETSLEKSLNASDEEVDIKGGVRKGTEKTSNESDSKEQLVKNTEKLRHEILSNENLDTEKRSALRIKKEQIEGLKLGNKTKEIKPSRVEEEQVKSRDKGKMLKDTEAQSASKKHNKPKKKAKYCLKMEEKNSGENESEYESKEEIKYREASNSHEKVIDMEVECISMEMNVERESDRSSKKKCSKKSIRKKKKLENTASASSKEDNVEMKTEKLLSANIIMRETSTPVSPQRKVDKRQEYNNKKEEERVVEQDEEVRLKPSHYSQISNDELQYESESSEECTTSSDGGGEARPIEEQTNQKQQMENLRTQIDKEILKHKPEIVSSLSDIPTKSKPAGFKESKKIVYKDGNDSNTDERAPELPKIEEENEPEFADNESSTATSEEEMKSLPSQKIKQWHTAISVGPATVENVTHDSSNRERKKPKKRNKQRERSRDDEDSSSPLVSPKESQPVPRGRNNRERRENAPGSSGTDESSPESDESKTLTQSETKALLKMFKQYFGKLCYTLKGTPEEVAVELQKESLITISTVRNILSSPESQQSKAISLVDDLQKKLKLHPARILKISWVFLRIPVLQEIGREMIAKTERICHDRAADLLDITVQTQSDLHPYESAYFALYPEPELGDTVSTENQVSTQQTTAKCSQSSEVVSGSVPESKLSPELVKYRQYLQSIYRARKLAVADKYLPTIDSPYINLAMINRGTCYQGDRDEFTKQTLHGGVDEILANKTHINIKDLLVPSKDECDKEEFGAEFSDWQYHLLHLESHQNVRVEKQSKNEEKKPKPVRFVMVEGPPGIGKSTFAWEICRRWNEIESLRKFLIILLLKLREKWVLNATSLADLFRYEYDPGLSERIVKELLEPEVQKKVLIILDGFDEVSHSFHKDSIIKRILHRQLLPECTIILTTRPSAKATLYSICQPRVDKHVEIIGFTEEERVRYIIEVFSNEPELQANFLKYMFLVPHIKSMMYIPLNCAIIAQVYYESQSSRHLAIPKTRTQLYAALTHSLLVRHMKTKEGSRECTGTLPEGLNKQDMEKFKVLAKFSFDTYHNSGRSMKVTFFNEDIPEGLVHFGFMNESSEMYAGKGVEKIFSFLHLSLQEYLAAWHLAHSYSIEFQVDYHHLALQASQRQFYSVPQMRYTPRHAPHLAGFHRSMVGSSHNLPFSSHLLQSQQPFLLDQEVTSDQILPSSPPLYSPGFNQEFSPRSPPFCPPPLKFDQEYFQTPPLTSHKDLRQSRQHTNRVNEEFALLMSLELLGESLVEPAVFLAGITGWRCQSDDVRNFWETYLSHDTAGVDNTNMLLRSLYEAQNPIIIPQYFIYVKRRNLFICSEAKVGMFENNHSIQTPYACYGLSYCLANSSDQFSLSISIRGYSDVSLVETFVKGIDDHCKSTKPPVKNLELDFVTGSLELKKRCLFWLTKLKFAGKVEIMKLKYEKSELPFSQEFFQSFNNLKSATATKPSIIIMGESDNTIGIEWLPALQSLTELEVLSIKFPNHLCNPPSSGFDCLPVEYKLREVVLDTILPPRTIYDICSPTDRMIGSLLKLAVRSHHNLTKIVLPNISRETMAGIHSILLHCPNLETLDLKGTRLGYDGILFISSALRSSTLKHLLIHDDPLLQLKSPPQSNAYLLQLKIIKFLFKSEKRVALSDKTTCTDFLLQLNNILKNNTTLEDIDIQSGLFLPLSTSSDWEYSQWTGLGPLEQFNVGAVASGRSPNLRRSFSSSDLTQPQTTRFWHRGYYCVNENQSKIDFKTIFSKRREEGKRLCSVPSFTAPDTEVLQSFSGLDHRLKKCLKISDLHQYVEKLRKTYNGLLEKITRK